MDRPQALPWSLGLAGLLPFATLAAMLLSGRTFGYPPTTVSFALATYGATIASFLGGIRWGIAVVEPGTPGNPADYLVSVVPQLLAWAALGLPDRARLIAIGLVILALGPLDLDLVRRHRAPAWFGRLRIVLSLTAGLCLLAAALG